MNLFGESEAPGLPGAPAAEARPRRPWYSPSRLKTFLECPKKYEFQVVKKIPTKPQPFFDLGANVHAALRDWMRLPPARRTWDGLLEFYRAAWRKNRPAFANLTRDELRTWGERGIVMLRHFADESPADLEPLAVEKSVTVDFGDVVVGGRVDRIDELPDGSLRVVDYKTGKVPKDEARSREGDLAPAVYARGATEAFVGIPVSEVEYLYLEGMERRVITVDAAWQAHSETVIAGLARRAHAAEVEGTFPATPSPLCRYCDFLSSCPEGRGFLDARAGGG